MKSRVSSSRSRNNIIQELRTRAAKEMETLEGGGVKVIFLVSFSAPEEFVKCVLQMDDTLAQVGARSEVYIRTYSGNGFLSHGRVLTDGDAGRYWSNSDIERKVRHADTVIANYDLGAPVWVKHGQQGSPLMLYYAYKYENLADSVKTYDLLKRYGVPCVASSKKIQEKLRNFHGLDVPLMLQAFPFDSSVQGKCAIERKLRITATIQDNLHLVPARATVFVLKSLKSQLAGKVHLTVLSSAKVEHQVYADEHFYPTSHPDEVTDFVKSTDVLLHLSSPSSPKCALECMANGCIPDMSKRLLGVWSCSTWREWVTFQLF